MSALSVANPKRIVEHVALHAGNAAQHLIDCSQLDIFLVDADNGIITYVHDARSTLFRYTGAFPYL